MNLSEAKGGIDSGATAKLTFTGERTKVVIRIKTVKHGATTFYAWQHTVEGVRPYPDIPPTTTDEYSTWEGLLEAIDGDQTTSAAWLLNFEPLLPYHIIPPTQETAHEH